MEDQQGLNIEAEGVLEGVVGEAKLAVQIDMLPAHGRAGGDGVGHVRGPRVEWENRQYSGNST